MILNPKTFLGLRSKLPLFLYKPLSNKKNVTLKVSELKTDCELFSRLYINGDIDEFFSQENQSYPPSLSHQGSSRLSTKSDLITCLCKTVDTQIGAEAPNIDALIVDGAVIVQMLQPGCSRTFNEYFDMIFVPYIKILFKKIHQIDIVFDVYYKTAWKHRLERNVAQIQELALHRPQKFQQIGRNFSVSMTIKLNCSISYQKGCMQFSG